MQNLRWIYIAAAGIAIIGLLMLIDRIAEPPPADPGPGPRVSEETVKASIPGNLDAVVCDFAKDGATAFPASWYFPGDKGETLIVPAGTLSQIFDVDSPRTAEAHDQLVLPEEPPSELQPARKGTALLLCDKQRLGIAIIRHYCTNSASAHPWNNEIEAIAFPKYAEVWLSDEIYASLATPGEYTPAPALLQELRAAYKHFAIKDSWKARKFSEVLPPAPGVAPECRKDFDGVEKFE